MAQMPGRREILVVLSHDIVASGKGFPGARTALSARHLHWERNVRTKLFALLWLWLGRAMYMRKPFGVHNVESPSLIVRYFRMGSKSFFIRSVSP